MGVGECLSPPEFCKELSRKGSADLVPKGAMGNEHGS
jgi:hypothetical protein